jgi:tol-pal system protein YbgF
MGGGALFLGGCATHAGVGKLQIDVDRMQSHLWVLSQQMKSIDSLLQAQQVEAQQRWTELSTDGENLSQQVARLQARVDNVADRMKDLSQGVESNRLYGGSKGGSARRPAQAAATADSARGPEPGLVADAQGLYRQALDDQETRNYALAISEFAQFIEYFPKDNLADNAAYWIGECYYAQKDFPQAIAAFQRVLTEYPEGDKVPAAMLKLGYAYLETKDRAKGQQQLRDLVKRYPDSEEARLAKERLGAGAKPGARR